jgi:hypothetical protein
MLQSKQAKKKSNESMTVSNFGGMTFGSKIKKKTGNITGAPISDV